MRILQTTHSYPPAKDGVAQVVAHVSEQLARRGHEVHVASTRLRGMSVRETLRGVDVHRFQVAGSRRRGFSGEVEDYRSLVLSDRWDVVVHHCVSHWAFDSLMDDLSECDRHVLVSHGLGPRTPNRSEYFDRLADLLPKLSGWACVSSHTEEMAFARELGVPEPTVLQNGVDLAEWRGPASDVRSQWRIGDAPWVINVSNHNPLKGHTVLHRLPRLIERADVRFTLIGGGLPLRRLNLERLGVRGGCYYSCHLRSIRSGVQLKTNACRATTRSAIQSATVLVAPSLWEANSIVLLEAMAAGTPWISFDVGSARANPGGFVVNDIGEMVQALGELLDNAPLRAELGAAGKAHVQAHHSWDRIADDYERLLRLAARCEAPL